MRLYKILFFISTFVCLGLHPLAWGEDVNVKEVQTEGSKIFEVSLEDVSKLALKNNFDIQLAKYDTWIARTKKGNAVSIYDTIVEAEVSYKNDEKAKSSTIFGTKVTDHDYNIGVNKKLPTGTKLSLDLDNNRQASNSSFATSSVTHESNLQFGIVQELGKNFFGVNDRGNVKVTLLDIESAEYISLSKIEDYLTEVQKAYFNLAASLENVKIEKSMLEQAKKLHDLHQEKLEKGLVEKPEAIATEANYQSRLNDVLIAENQAASDENVLKLLLDIDDENIYIYPIEDFQLEDTKEDFVGALQRAFDNRPDYKQHLTDVKARKIQLSMKKNNLWPEINLSATWAQNGLGDGFPDAVTKTTAENNSELFTGLTFKMPLENRDARAEYKKAKLEDSQTLIKLKYIEREISINIADKVRRCNILKEIARNGRVIVALQDQKLTEELQRFKFGRSDTDTIIRFQTEALEGQKNAVLLALEYYKAVADLRKEEGTLLQQYWDEKL